MRGALRAVAALSLGLFAGATLLLFPAALAGFRLFPDDPGLAGRIAGGIFDAYAPVAWGTLGVGTVALATARLRRAAGATAPLVCALLAALMLGAWLLGLRPVVDAAGRARRDPALAPDARAAAEATFHRWHGVSLALAFAALAAGAAACATATRVAPREA